MAIIGKAKKPVINDDLAERFVSGADATIAVKETKPEKAEQTKRTGRGRKKPVSMTIAPDLIAKVDMAAKSAGMSRAAYVSMALNYAVTHGIFK